MNWRDSFQFSGLVLLRHKTRTALLMFSVAIGVCSVLLLTSVGEGARQYINREFAAIGSNMLIVLPGKKQTSGGSLPIYATSPRDLTIEDAQALRRIRNVRAIAPIIAGTGLVSFESRSREVITLGSTMSFLDVRNLVIGEGGGFKVNAVDYAEHVAILGAKVKTSLFNNENAIGQRIKIADRRYRVIGVLAERGESLGLDMRDMVIIPVRSAESLFNSPALFRIIIATHKAELEQQTQKQIIELIKSRHDDEEDITIVSQNAMMSSFDNISNMVTIAIGVIAGISLIVAGLLVMNVSYISVAKRRSEIGLLKAIGATSKEVRTLFVVESSILMICGVILGLMSGHASVVMINSVYQDFTLLIPLWANLASVIVSMIIGVVFTWLPAEKAAQLDPVTAMKAN
jgi:putative ABC transport system permease protein